MSIFKSYDIRGIFGTEWDGQTAYRIGRHLPALLGARRIAVGYDARPSSVEILRELCRGVVESGCSVADIGMCDTPAVYFATAFYDLDGSVMITASHNPPEYNGLKVSARQAVPVGGETGLKELEARVAVPLPPMADGPGAVEPLDIRRDYLSHLGRFRSDLRGIRGVIDCSNGTAGVYLREVLGATGGSFSYLFDRPDGTFPNHAPNPLIESNLSVIKARVGEEKADLGICFDGDADRVVFIDEKGRFISPDLIIGLLGMYFFRRHPDRIAGGTNAVTYDVRTSRSVVELLTSLGGDPRICRVGHSFAKKLLRETHGIFGGELAGHYYFRENFFCDSAFMAALAVLELLRQEAAARSPTSSRPLPGTSLPGRSTSRFRTVPRS